MAKGNNGVHKVFFQGDHDDFIVFIEDPAILRKWKNDRSIPLTQVVNGYKIFITHRRGAQGIHDEAGKAILDTEFGTTNEDKCITAILEKGEIQESESRARPGSTNDSMGVYLTR